MERRYLAIVNKEIPQEDLERLKRIGEVVRVPEGESIVELLERYGDGYSGIVSVGGDGTAGKVMWYAAGKDIPVVAIPYGTGNDIPSSAVRNFDKEEYIKCCFDALENGGFTEQKYDVIEFEADGRKYRSVVGLHLGLFANACKTERLKKLFGSGAYIVRGVADIISYRPKPITIKVNGEQVYQGGIWAGQVANTPTTGGGRVYMDGVDPRDGELTLVYLPVENVRRRELPGLISDLTDMVNLEQVEVVRGVREFEIDGKVTLGYCGEYLGPVEHVSGRVIPRAAKLCVPYNIYNTL